MDNLYEWQKDAYKIWKENNCVGVIEAVTGSGKTRIAHEAILEHLQLDYDILIIVPTKELLQQWNRDIRKLQINRELVRNKYTIKLLGGGIKDDGSPKWDIFISLVHSAINKEFKLGTHKGLLIADECHHYGAPEFNRALKTHFEKRMGLTATYQRDDNGIDQFLNPYFSTVCFSLTYERALKENVIARFKVAFIGVDLNEEEEYNYKKLDKNCSDIKQKLMQKGVVAEPFGEFIREVSTISHERSDLSRLARAYLANFSQRRSLLANAANKYNFLNYITDSIREADRTIIFSQTVEAATKAIGIIRSNNINGDVLNSGMADWQRKDVLADFESGDTDVVAAPLLLDEGINVPSADLAIIMASSRNKRQMIQRMGRVLRKKSDNRKAKIVVVFSKNTSEDPKLGAHEDFMEDIERAADSVKIFNSKDAGIKNYLYE
jgi:RNA polymerase primary sigma factor